MTSNNPFLATTKPAITKAQKAEEGLEGLPEEFEIKTEKNKEFNNSSTCESCGKNLNKKLVGIFSSSSRHHCRRCGKTVCDRCWKNLKRLSKKDSNYHNVCDQCDFEISNYHVYEIFEKIKEKQQQS